MPITVTEITFNPAFWAGAGGGTAGKDAFGLVFDQDGLTGWAFEYFDNGFARFNLSDGTIVHQDATFGTPGAGNGLYTHEDGSVMFAQDNASPSHYYTLPNYGNTLYKSHVAAGPAGNLFNGYMIDDATLSLAPMNFNTIEGYNNPIVPASDGNRYLFLANNGGAISVGAVNVDTMTIIGQWPTLAGSTLIRQWGSQTFMDKFGDFWAIGQPRSNADLTSISITANVLTATFTTAHTYLPGDVVYLGAISGGAPTPSYLNYQPLTVLTASTFSFTASFFHADDSQSGLSGFCTNTSIILVKWHPADGATGSILNFTTAGTGQHRINASVLGHSNGIEFVAYDAVNHSVVLGNSNQETGDLVEVDLTAFTQNALHLDDSSIFYSGTFDAPESTMFGTDANGKFALPGQNIFGGLWSPTDLGGVFNLIDPVTLAVSDTHDVTSLINASVPPDLIVAQNINNVLYSHITSVQSNGSVVTFTGANNLTAGNVNIQVFNLVNATQFNGSIFTVLSASATQWTATDASGFGVYGPTAEPQSKNPPFGKGNAGGGNPQSLPPFGNMQWNPNYSGVGKLAVTYEFVGSPVYLLTLNLVTVPTVTTQAESSINIHTATANGNITNLGGAPNCTLEGFVFDTVSHALPGNVAPGSSGYAQNITSSGTFGTGPYTGAMSGLAASTTYFVRAVAQNSAGYSYGNEISFTTLAAPLNSSTSTLISSLAPSHFEDEVTFTVTVSDPITGDPNANTAPLCDLANPNVLFIADGSFGFGSAPLVPLTAAISKVQASATIATYTAPNSFTAGQKVVISGFGGGFTQFNQSGVGGHGVVIASANASSFTVNGSYTVQAQANQDGTATSTSASSCSASTTVLISGLHTIQAQYLGDSTPITGHIASNSNILTQQVVAVNTLNTVEFPGFSLVASFSTSGDQALIPQAQLEAIPAVAHVHQSISLLWTTLNVAFVRITGNNGVDYQPSGFDTGLISTSGSGIYVVGNGFTANITLNLQAYDASQNPIGGVTANVHIVIS